MCGIAMVYGDGAAQAVSLMLERLEHRGPDEVGLHALDEHATVLGHTRLSIMDPEHGHQPMVDGDAAVIANGEIYNHATLRDDLDGVEFRTGSDTEVLLPLHERHGADLAERLDGMFAFVISDDGKVVAGRDPIGIKPLYRARRGDAVAFASELKALAGDGWDQVEAVPPGHVWVDGTLQQYYEVPAARTDGATDDEAVERWCEALRTTLDRAVHKRLMADVPVGAFLSGGLDSSIVAALAARHFPDLQTFPLGFEGSADHEAARLVAEHLGTRHHEILVPEDEVVAVLPEVLYHLESWDADLVRSALPTYLVARFAAEHLKVVLTGEGADELFAGYRYHADYRDDPATLQHELRRSVTAMHDSNLQRVDRMTMAHALEGRVPFLDKQVVDLAMRIPAELKQRTVDGTLVEKWILRQAFTDLLPPEIVWRTKSQFDEGSGTTERLVELAASSLEHSDWTEWPEAQAAGLRSQEEAWYFAGVRDHFPDDWQKIRANTSPWAEGRIPVGQH